MKFYLSLMALLAISQLAWTADFNVTCFYDTFSIQRGGNANFTENDLKRSFEYCNQVVYGYVGLKPDTFELNTLHDKQHLQFQQVKKLKNQYRHIKFLVSLGGDKDLNKSEKYLKLLEATDSKQKKFINSVRAFLKKYNFDGLDLAYQFPHNKTKSSSFINSLASRAKGIIGKKSIGGKASKIFNGGSHTKTKSKTNNLMHKHQFTALISKLKNTLRHDRLMLTLTVLPHVNVSTYLNIPSIMHDLDLVILGTFDYSTPYRTPKEADFLAPLFKPRHRSQNSYIQKDVGYWLSQHFPRNKLVIGIAAYGRTWKMDKALKSSEMPIRSSLNGPAKSGEWTHTPGLLSRPEICFKLSKMSKTSDKNEGSYAYRSTNVKGNEGVFLTYDNEENIAVKANFVRKQSLAGVALFDLSLDDFRGKCNRGTFPVLKSFKYYN